MKAFDKTASEGMILMTDKSRSAPTVGVVVPAYNAGQFLAETLESVRCQTHARLECIVVNDGSSDETSAVARRFASHDSRFRLLEQRNQGVATARNRGLDMLSQQCRYVVCMDADDVWESFAVERLIAALDAEPSAVAAHGLAELIDKVGRPVEGGWFAELGRSRLDPSGGQIRSYPADAPTLFRTVVTSSTIFPPGLILIRREALARTGGYDAAVQPADDWDMVIRLSRLGHLCFVNEVILRYRRHSRNGGAGSTVPEMCRRVYHKAFMSPDNTAEHSAIMRDSWKAKQRALLGQRYREGRNAIGKGRLPAAATSFARMPFIAYRYVRGYPTLRWL